MPQGSSAVRPTNGLYLLPFMYLLIYIFIYVFSSFLISCSLRISVPSKFFIWCTKWNTCSDEVAKSTVTNWKPSLTPNLTKTENCAIFLASPLSGISIKTDTKFLHFSSRSHCVSLFPAAGFENLIFSIDLFLRLQHSFCLQYLYRGTRWRSWLRHCATNRKVAGSIPDGVSGNFHWHNPSGLTMALRLPQPLTEMSTRNISWAVKAASA